MADLSKINPTLLQGLDPSTLASPYTSEPSLQQSLVDPKIGGFVGDVQKLADYTRKLSLNQSVTPTQGLGPNSMEEIATSGLPKSKLELAVMLGMPLVGAAIGKLAGGVKGLGHYAKYTGDPEGGLSHPENEPGMSEVVWAHPDAPHQIYIKKNILSGGKEIKYETKLYPNNYGATNLIPELIGNHQLGKQYNSFPEAAQAMEDFLTKVYDQELSKPQSVPPPTKSTGQSLVGWYNTLDPTEVSPTYQSWEGPGGLHIDTHPTYNGQWKVFNQYENEIFSGESFNDALKYANGYVPPVKASSLLPKGWEVIDHDGNGNPITWSPKGSHLYVDKVGKEYHVMDASQEATFGKPQTLGKFNSLAEAASNVETPSISTPSKTLYWQHPQTPALQVWEHPSLMNPGKNVYTWSHEGENYSSFTKPKDAIDAAKAAYGDFYPGESQKIYPIDAHMNSLLNTLKNEGAEKPGGWAYNPKTPGEWALHNSLVSDWPNQSKLSPTQFIQKFGQDLPPNELNNAYGKYLKTGKDPRPFMGPQAYGPPKQSLPLTLERDTSLHDLINSRDVVYHTTTPSNALSILREGKIQPGGGNRFQGVAMSRIPTIGPKSLPVTFVIDRTKLPKFQPTADESFEKTSSYHTGSKFEQSMNPSFEFEYRTKGQPVPTSAIKGVYLNEDKFKSYDYEDDNGTIQQFLEDVKPHLDQMGIQAKVVPGKKQLRSIRANFLNLPKGSPLFGLGGIAAGLKYVNSTPTPSQGGEDKTKGDRY